LLTPDAIFQRQNTPNSISPMFLPQTPLGSLQRSEEKKRGESEREPRYKGRERSGKERKKRRERERREGKKEKRKKRGSVQEFSIILNSVALRAIAR